MVKKGDIWISAVLYMALGIVILTIILAAGLPVINRIRDKNLAIDTKESMFTLDKNIREVYNEGPGSQRPLTLDIKKGNFIIDQDLNEINWSIESTVQLSDLDTVIQEGTLSIHSTKTTSNDYLIIFGLDYDPLNIDLVLNNPVNSLSGTNKLIVLNQGVTDPINNPNKVTIQISVI